MPPRRAPCQICTEQESKYTCSTCHIVYCSVSCYKTHKTSCDVKLSDSPPEMPNNMSEVLVDIPEPAKPLRPLTSLNWPYVPDQSAYPDPLQRDDPKPLQTHQYEAIATSEAIRRVLAEHQNLPALLSSLDALRGHDRERALQRALGVTPPDIALADQSTQELGDDVVALRALAEAVEAAVRGDKSGTLGLDWERE